MLSSYGRTSNLPPYRDLMVDMAAGWMSSSTPSLLSACWKLTRSPALSRVAVSCGVLPAANWTGRAFWPASNCSFWSRFVCGTVSTVSGRALLAAVHEVFAMVASSVLMVVFSALVRYVNCFGVAPPLAPEAPLPLPPPPHAAASSAAAHAPAVSAPAFCVRLIVGLRIVTTWAPFSAAPEEAARRLLATRGLGPGKAGAAVFLPCMCRTFYNLLPVNLRRRVTSVKTSCDNELATTAKLPSGQGFPGATALVGWPGDAALSRLHVVVRYRGDP